MIVTSKPPSGTAFALLGLVQFVLILAISVVVVPLPAISGEFGLSGSDLVLLTAGYGLAFAGLLLLGGRLADLFGRRRTSLLGVAVFGAASGAAAAAPAYGLLIAARFTQGVGAALAAPAAMALLGTVFAEPARRARALAVWGVVASAGATAGTLLSGLIASWLSWRWAFALPALVAVLVVMAAPRLLPAGPGPVPARLDLPGALLATFGLIWLSYGLVQAGEHGFGSATVLVPLIMGVVGLAAFAAVERRAMTPLLPLSFLRSPNRAVALLAIMLAAAGSAGSIFLLSLYFQQIRHFTPVQTSVAFIPYALVLLTGVVAGRLIAHLGADRVTAIGLAIGAAGLGMLATLGVDSSYPLIPFVVFTIGAGLTFSGSTVAIMQSVPDEQAGLAGGVLNTAMEIGPPLGLAVLVTAAGHRTNHLTHAGLDAAPAITSGYGFALGGTAIAFLVTAVLSAIVLRRPS